MKPRASFDKWRTILGFSLVISVINPLLPLPLWVDVAVDIWNEVILGEPSCILYRDTSAEAQLMTLNVCLLQYKTLNRSLPSTEQGLKGLTDPPLDARSHKRLAEPSQILDPWGRPYQYRKNEFGSNKQFDIWSLGEDGVNGTADDVRND